MNTGRNQSRLAIRWLKYIAYSEGVHVAHRDNGGEKAIRVGDKQYFVDGWTEPCEKYPRGMIWEFLGMIISKND